MTGPHEHVAHEHVPHTAATRTVSRSWTRALRPLAEPSLFSAAEAPPTTGGTAGGRAAAARHPVAGQSRPDQLGVGVVVLSGLLVGLGLVAGVLSRSRRRSVPDALI
jgi:hypothetical protein